MASTESISDATGSRVMIRLGAVALALSGLLFFLYPAVRPWHDESILGGAVASMSSNAWVAAHVFAILALILMPLGMLALFGLSAGTRGAGLTLAGTVIIWVGAGLTLPYYGAEDFALHAIASQVRSGTQLDLLGLVHSIRFSAVAASTFAAGLLLLALGGVLVAISIWRTAVLPRLSGVPLAIALVLFFPQFYLPAWARIAHGTLVALALILLAGLLWTATQFRAASRAHAGSTASSTSAESQSTAMSVPEGAPATSPLPSLPS
jgi:hypothetical protein